MCICIEKSNFDQKISILDEVEGSAGHHSLLIQGEGGSGHHAPLISWGEGSVHQAPQYVGPYLLFDVPRNPCCAHKPTMPTIARTQSVRPSAVPTPSAHRPPAVRSVVRLNVTTPVQDMSKTGVRLVWTTPNIKEVYFHETAAYASYKAKL